MDCEHQTLLGFGFQVPWASEGCGGRTLTSFLIVGRGLLFKPVPTKLVAKHSVTFSGSGADHHSPTEIVTDHAQAAAHMRNAKAT